MKAAEDHTETNVRPGRLALEFRHDVIALIEADAGGSWTDIRTIRLDAPSFSDEISKLRREAQKRTGKPKPGVDLMLPAAQVLSFDAPPEVIAKNRFLRAGAVATALAGRSPVPASALSFDWAILDGGAGGVSAVEQTVVAEACVYARRWGFEPKRVTSRAAHPAFMNGPDFTPIPVYRTKPALAGGSLVVAALLVWGGLALLSDTSPVAENAPVSESVIAITGGTEISPVLPSPSAVMPAPAALSTAGLDDDDASPSLLTGVPEPRVPSGVSGAGPALFDMATAATPPVDADSAPLPAPSLRSLPGAVLVNAPPHPGDAQLSATAAEPIKPATIDPASPTLLAPGPTASLTNPLVFAPEDEATLAMALVPPVPRPGSEEAAIISEAEAEPEAQEEAITEESVPDTPANAELAAEEPVENDPREAGPEAEPDDENIPGPGSVATSPAPKGRPDHLDMTPSKLAVATAPRPAPRPKSIKPRPQVIATASGEIPKTVRTPSRGAPSGPGVANAATLRDAIQLEDMNLLGVFGSKTSRRALLRMPDGQIIRASKGTVVDGWVVARIDATSVRMTRGGTAQTLNVAR